ncbi:MAG TPA: DUF4363 family protein [Romboutsia timonensis]|uniref:DUF4363 family protein n=1 Tax=Romboutsia timonensis TaxID=1776391 RepID=A0A921SYP6_9FIRM|nr:DUF4363 family protein [Romboutsia timonensis]
MKHVIAVLVWTLLFVSLGIYSENKIHDFTNKFNSEIEFIQKDIEDDKLDEALVDIKNWSKSWHKEKEFWYKIVDHEYFDDICLSLNILEQSVKYTDKLAALEQIETIKMLLNNILESEKCDLNHIF